MALARHRLGAHRHHGAQGRGGGTRCSGRHRGDGRPFWAQVHLRDRRKDTPTARERSRKTLVLRGHEWGAATTSRRRTARWKGGGSLGRVSALPRPQMRQRTDAEDTAQQEPPLANVCRQNYGAPQDPVEPAGLRSAGHVTGSSLGKAEVACGSRRRWAELVPESSWSPAVGASKMKVKMLSRNPDNYVRETKLDLQRGKISW